jgi:hypothetical protein
MANLQKKTTQLHIFYFFKKINRTINSDIFGFWVMGILLTAVGCSIIYLIKEVLVEVALFIIRLNN